MKIKMWALGTGIAFYGLLIDMCWNLGGWRVFEPFAFLITVLVAAALGRVIFEDEAA